MKNLWKLFEGEFDFLGLIDLEERTVIDGTVGFAEWLESLEKPGESESFFGAIQSKIDMNDSEPFQFERNASLFNFHVSLESKGAAWVKGNKDSVLSFVKNEKSLEILGDLCLLTVADTSGEIIHCSESIIQKSGYSKEELQENGYRVLNSNFHEPEFFKNLWETILGGSPWRGEIRNKNKEGSCFWVDCHIVPHFNNQGEIDCFINFSVDITSRKNQEEEALETFRKLELALDATNLGTMFWNLENNEVKFDERWQKITGNPTSLMNIDEFQSQIHEKDRAKFFKVVKSYLEGDSKNAQIIFRFNSPQKKTVYLKFRGEIFDCDANGNPTVFLATATDFTNYILQEIKIRKSFGEVDSILQSIPGALCILNEEFLISYNSPSWREIINYGGGSKGKSLDDIFEEVPLELRKTLDQAIDGVKSKYEGHLKVRDQDEKFYSLKFSPYVNKGKKSGIVVHLEDRNDHFKLREELEAEKLRSIQTSKMASIGEVSGSIAHEINNPLTIINGYLQQMELFQEEGTLTEDKLRTLLGKTQNTVMRVSKIVSGLKNFSRDGNLDEPNLISFKTIIETTLTLCSHKIQSSGTNLEIIGDSSVEFICQEIQLSQVLVNLISNSCDEIGGQDDPWIKIYLEDLGERLKIRIVDSGPGIPNHIVEKLFTPYFTSKEKGKGTGLGMCISMNIVKAHKGKLSYEKFNGNTSFLIDIPKDPTDESLGENEQKAS